MDGASFGYAVCRSARITSVETIMDAETISKIEALPDEYNGVAHRFTADEDEMLRRYWKRKNQKDIARLMGLSISTLKARYRKLMGGKVCQT